MSPIKPDNMQDGYGAKFPGDDDDQSVCSNFSEVLVGPSGTLDEGFDLQDEELYGNSEELEKGNINEGEPVMGNVEETDPTHITPAGSPEKVCLPLHVFRAYADYQQPNPSTPIAFPKFDTTTPHTSRKRPQEDVDELTPRPASRSPRQMTLSATPETPVKTDTTVPKTPTNADNAPNLVDFTVQFNRITKPKTPGTGLHKRLTSLYPSPTKMQLPPTTPTESRFFNLLDFSPAPPKSPSSIPSITPREVDEIKLAFETQLSQLRAELAGRETEVTSLRSTIGAIEARLAEFSAAAKAAAQQHEADREEWMRVKEEMGELFQAEQKDKEEAQCLLAEKEQALETLQNEVTKKDSEVVNLRKRLRDTEDDGDRTREEVLRLKKELDEKANTVPVFADRPAPAEATTLTADPALVETAAAEVTRLEVEKVARQLHTLYKKKHEEKVSALKVSYSSRWEKKIAHLEQQLELATKRNDELAKELDEKKDDGLTGDMSFSAAHDITGVSSEEIQNLQKQIDELKMELEDERKQKSEILTLTEEFLGLQRNEQEQEQGQERQQQLQQQTTKEERTETIPSATKEESPRLETAPSPNETIRSSEPVQPTKPAAPPKKRPAPSSGMRSHIEKMRQMKKAQVIENNTEAEA